MIYFREDRGLYLRQYALQVCCQSFTLFRQEKGLCASILRILDTF